MTAETSNARGELRMADIREDAREPLQLLREKLAHDEDGWAALCRLMPMLAAAPPPAAAEPKTLPVPTRVYLTDKAAVIVGDPQHGWDEEGPEAHNCDDMGCSTIGPHVLARVPFTDERALSQQPEARGVVDDAMVERAYRAWRKAAVAREGNRPAIRAALTAALTEARNVR